MYVGGIAGAAVFAIVVWVSLPVPKTDLTPQSTRAVTIEDRSGARLRSTRATDGSQAQWIAVDRIDPDIINAFIAVEDRRFWDHNGIDLRALLRAVRDNVAAHSVRSGASTITMQLARLLHPSARRWDGKIVQALWALRLEAHLTKQQILEQYLNRVQLGQNTTGVGAASALYFGASASDVSIAQAATLAGLAHAPSRDNPLSSPRRSNARRTHALRRMERLGYATHDDVLRARDERAVSSAGNTPFLAPHFTTRVLSWLADDSLPAGTTTVRTSLDLGLQEAVESEVRYTVQMMHDRSVEQAAAVVLDNATGEVRAWVGSPDFADTTYGQTDMVVSPRQPGSSLKPFLYGLALDRGFTPATVLADIPRAYATATGSYAPRNYDRRFRGPVRAREALASSYNVPAVELASRVGVGTLLRTLQDAGFTSLQRSPDYYGLGLALGDGDVSLIELANGYRALAAGGAWSPWTWHPSDGRVASAGTRRIISPVSSAILLDMLSDPEARVPGFGINTPFDFPFQAAVKTGTSRHFTDNWAVATTQGFTVAVWAGNFNGRPMQGVSGVTGAGPLLHRVVMETARHIAPGVLPSPAQFGAERVAVCRLSGMRATPSCAQLSEWFAPGTAPRLADTWERNGRVQLPEEYAEWARQERPSAVIASAGLALHSHGRADAPTVDSTAILRRFRIASPRDGDKYAIPAGVEAQYATIPLRAAGAGSNAVRWQVDGRPYAGSRWPLAKGEHVIRATGEDGTSAEARVVVLP